MWTKKSLFVYVYLRFRGFRLPLIIPLRIFWECIEAIEDVLLFTGMRIGGMDMGKVIRSISQAVSMVSTAGKFDLVEVEAGNRVKIKIGLR